MMGSGVGAAEEAVNALVDQGEKVGLVKVRLFRPFSTHALVAALPPTVQNIAVLDRTKEPGAVGEPLLQCWSRQAPEKSTPLNTSDGDSVVEASPDAVTVTFDSTLPTTEGTLPGSETWYDEIVVTVFD